MKRPLVMAADKSVQESQDVLSIPVIDTRIAAYLSRPRLGDRVLAAFLLVVASPLIFLLVALVRLTSKGPGIYSQVRVGKLGKPFLMYKIRTMVADAETENGPQWAVDNDPRVTPIGIFLRKFHLDELPQLLNVVRGEMTIMGPRPERPQMVSILAEKIPSYLDRLAIQPGITGLAQINLPPDTDLESVQRKLELDIEYIQKASFGLDLRMLVWTALRLLGVPAGIATPMLRLERATAAKRDTKSVSPESDQPLTIDRILAFDDVEPQRDEAAVNRSSSH